MKGPTIITALQIYKQKLESAAAPTEGEAEPDETGTYRTPVIFPSINEIKDKIADLIHGIGARDLFRTGYEEQDRNRTLNPGQGSDQNHDTFVVSRPKPVQEHLR